MTAAPVALPEVDRIEVTTLYDCLVDATAPNVPRNSGRVVNVIKP